MRALLPSLLAADFYQLKDQIEELEKNGVHSLHMDIMDGKNVPSISFGMPVLSAIRKHTKLFFDVHMMVDEPDRFIDDMVIAGADMITVHQECTPHLDRTIAHIHSKDIQAGVALNPATPLSTLEEILPELDYVLLMTVNPGFGGQKYISYCTEKIKKLAKIRAERNLHFQIEVDGGINRETLATVLDAGADMIVAGSAIFGSNITDNVQYFQKVMDNEE
jgi:ribulose-phosphate 3-epimerase